MSVEDFIRFMLVGNIISSILNVILYGIGYFGVSRARVDSKYSLTRKTLLLDFVISIAFAFVVAVVSIVVLITPEFTTPALYLLGSGLFVFNLSYNIRAVLLAIITNR